MNKLSAVILTKNEKSSLDNCLKSVLWCDEILIIDDFSTDKTVSIDQKYGAKIIKRKLNNNFAQQRNFGLKSAKYDWVLFIDADEVVTGQLKKDILHVLLDPKYPGYYIKRQNNFFGQQLNNAEWGSAQLVRFGHRSAGKWKRAVHEYWDIINVGKLEGILIHNQVNSIKKDIQKINYYSLLHAKENSKEGKDSNAAKVVIYPIGKFINNYILKRGYRDGVRGFIMAVMMSFHSFLSWGRLWLQKH